MIYTVRFNFERGNFLVCVNGDTDVQALSRAKKELGTALGSEAPLKRTTSIEIFKGALAGCKPLNT